MKTQTNCIAIVVAALAVITQQPLLSAPEGKAEKKAAPTEAKTLKIASILGTSPEEYEKVLGAPKAPGEYSAPGFKYICVEGGAPDSEKGKMVSKMVNISLVFAGEPLNDWKIAFHRLGIKTEGVKEEPKTDDVVPLSNIRGIPKDWAALWKPASNSISFVGPGSP